MEAVLNLLDEPRSWNSPISARLQGLLDNGARGSWVMVMGHLGAICGNPH
jgi:hypothetical protein